VRVLIATTNIPFRDSSTSEISEGLRRELVAHGHQADVACLPFVPEDDSVAEQVLALRLLDLSESCGNATDVLVAVGHGALAYRHPYKLAWLVPPRQKPGKPAGLPRAVPVAQRAQGVYVRECRRVYASSLVQAEQVARAGARRVDGLIYAPLPRDTPFRPGPFGAYLFAFARRLPAERLGLMMLALAHAPEVRLVLACESAEESGEATCYAERLGVQDRVKLISCEEAEWLAGCCGVVHPAEADAPVLPLEAFHAAKPVIALADAGAGAEVVEDGRNGWLAPAEPAPLGDAMHRLWQDRSRGLGMGYEAQATLRRRRIDWGYVVEKLIA
jgi:glycosyltransferase involved in cell wall biosynthesis